MDCSVQCEIISESTHSEVAASPSSPPSSHEEVKQPEAILTREIGLVTDPLPALSKKPTKGKSNPLSLDNIIKLDSDTVSQRLIESVQMVRELLQSNREL